MHCMCTRIEQLRGWQMVGSLFTVGVGIYMKAMGGGYEFHAVVDWSWRQKY